MTKLPFLKYKAFRNPVTNFEIEKEQELSEKEKLLFVNELVRIVSKSAESTKDPKDLKKLKKGIREKFESYFAESEKPTRSEAKKAVREYLQSALAIIYRHGIKSELISDDYKATIASALTQEMVECPPGFINRVSEVVLALQNDFTLTSVLAAIRKSILERVNYRIDTSPTVDQHTDILITARNMGYGVSADPKRPYESEYHKYYERYEYELTKIETLIQQTMTAHYHPLPILRQITTEIEAKLRNTSPQYAGAIAEDGYEYAIYKAWIKIIKQFLVPKEIDLCPVQGYKIEGFDPPDILLLDANNKAKDINWPALRYQLYQYLINQGYFDIPAQTQTVLHYLLNPTEKTIDDYQLAELFTVPDNTETSKAFIHSNDLFLHLLSLTPEHTKKEQLFDAYVSKFTTEDEANLFWQHVTGRAAQNPHLQIIVEKIAEQSIDKQASFCRQQAGSLITLMKLWQKHRENYNPQELVKTFLENLASRSNEEKRYRLKTIGELYGSAFGTCLKPLLERQLNYKGSPISTENFISYFKFKYSTQPASDLKFLVTTIPLFPVEQQVEMLTHILKKAVAKPVPAVQSKIIIPLREIISRLENKHKEVILLEAIKSIDNAFLSYQPDALDLIIQIMNTLDTEGRAALLKETNKYKRSLLMMAASDDDLEDRFKLLLDCLSTLKIKDQFSILQQADEDGDSVLMKVSRFQANVILFFNKHLRTSPTQLLQKKSLIASARVNKSNLSRMISKAMDKGGLQKILLKYPLLVEQIKQEYAQENTRQNAPV